MRRLAFISCCCGSVWAQVAYVGTVFELLNVLRRHVYRSCSFMLSGGTTIGAVAVVLDLRHDLDHRDDSDRWRRFRNAGGEYRYRLVSLSGTRDRNMIYCAATGSATGAQTVSVSWTGSSNASAGMVSASGVDQATLCNNGTTSSTTSATISTSITSSSGDLTFDRVSDGSGSSGYPDTPNRLSGYNFRTAASTQRWANRPGQAQARRLISGP